MVGAKYGGCKIRRVQNKLQESWIAAKYVMYL